jgi:hypothetical protein
VVVVVVVELEVVVLERYRAGEEALDNRHDHRCRIVLILRLCLEEYCMESTVMQKAVRISNRISSNSVVLLKVKEMKIVAPVVVVVTAVAVTRLNCLVI